MLKIGVIGAGHLGKIHISQLQTINSIDLIGFYDTNEETANLVSKEHKINHYASFDSLLNEVDAIVIVTPTNTHYLYASKAIKKGKHVFIEKPITGTVNEAKKILSLAKEGDSIVQVGHVERFNPAFMEAQKFLDNPMFIETHRLAQFNPRGTDVSVVLDLMIHDIDIILSVVKSNIKKISASGVAVVSDTPDITNARIEFDNGCVANLTASRISMKKMRKSRFFQRDAYISVDFLDKKLEVIRLKEINETEVDPLAVTINLGEGKKTKQIYFDNPEIKLTNAIKAELESFVNSINTGTAAFVSVDDGYKSLDVANKIMEKALVNTIQ